MFIYLLGIVVTLIILILLNRKFNFGSDIFCAGMFILFLCVVWPLTIILSIIFLLIVAIGKLSCKKGYWLNE